MSMNSIPLLDILQYSLKKRLIYPFVSPLTKLGMPCKQPQTIFFYNVNCISLLSKYSQTEWLCSLTQGNVKKETPTWSSEFKLW